MNLRHLTILPLFLTLHLGAQELYIPQNAEITITDRAFITAGGNLINDGQRLDVREGAEIVTYGSFTNNRFLINNGNISLYGDWINQGTFNSTYGSLTFLGGNDQIITDSYLLINNLTVNKMGIVTFTADSIKVLSELSFLDGVLTTSPNSRFIVEDTASIYHEFGSTSYFEGKIISRGTNNRIFPVGNGEFYGTLELLDIYGTNDLEVGVSLIHQNPNPPIPGQDLIGVSGENTWEIEYRQGTLDSTQLQIDFIAEDLENFQIRNSIQRHIDSPVIAVSDSGATGPFRSLGVALLTATDSVTTGVIQAEDYVKYEDYGSKYFAIALAPLIDPAGQIYFPNVFSPAASDPRNQTYRVFGEHIANEPFRMEIYNRFSTLVYEADTFEEATNEGWDGISLKTGKEEFEGIYYLFVKYAYTNDPQKIKEHTGSIMLKR